MTTSQSHDPQLEELLTRSYEKLRQVNPAQRQAVLDGLSVVKPADNSPRRSRRTLAAWSISALACALALFVIFSLRTNSSAGIAYGIDDLPERLLEVKTISLRGWRYVYDDSDKKKPPIRVPFEMLIKRPGMVRQTSLDVMQHDNSVEIRRGMHICDGSRVCDLNEDGSVRSSRVLNPIDVRLNTEQKAQSLVGTFLLAPSNAAFHKIGKDNVDGVRCDLWEARTPGVLGLGICRIWIDPTNGMPVRSDSLNVNVDGTTEHLSELTEIAFNTPLDDKLFQINAPKAAQVTDQPQAGKVVEIPLSSPTTELGAPQIYASLARWRALKISDNATLLVWGRSRPQGSADGNRDWLSGVTMTVMENGKKQNLRHAWLYQSNSSERWNWSLITTPDGKPFGRRATELALRTPNTQKSAPINAVQLKDVELQRILEAARRATLPDDADEMTLSDLRDRARQLLESKDAR